MKQRLICYMALFAAFCFLAGCGKSAAPADPTEAVVPSASASQKVEVSPTPSAATVPPVTEESVAAAINTASQFAWDWFYDNTHVDHTDVIMDDGMGGEWAYERINEAGIQTVQDVIQLTEQYFTAEAAKKLVSYKQWLEEENGLYVSATEGLGDPMIESYQIQMQKDSDTQYTLTIHTYFDGEPMLDPFEIQYQYVDGYWVFNHPLACYFEVPIEFIS